jgi:uncharacterized alpha-E superfamily protein
MLSRIADSMFWLNRYMERCDVLLRGVRTYYILLLDKGVNENLSWRIILETFATNDKEELNALENDTDAALYKLLFDTTNPNSLKILIHKARENARGMQDHITKEVWEQVNHLYHQVNQLSASDKLQGYDTLKIIDDLSQKCILFNGVTDTTMPRGMGWNFMILGKLIERCVLTIELSKKFLSQIDFSTENEKDILFWRPLLLALSGYELHLKTYRTASYNKNVLHQVLMNENFTRSVLYSLLRIENYFKQVVKNNNAEEKEALIKSLGRLVSKAKYTDFDSLNHLTLQGFLKETKRDLLDFSSHMAQTFFSYS